MQCIQRTAGVRGPIISRSRSVLDDRDAALRHLATHKNCARCGTPGGAARRSPKTGRWARICEACSEVLSGRAPSPRSAERIKQQRLARHLAVLRGARG
jgi:hypothetical protein